MDTQPPETELRYISGSAMGLLSRNESSPVQRKTGDHFWTTANSLALIYVLASIAFPIVLFVPVSGRIKDLYEMCDVDGDFDYDAKNLDPDDLYYTGVGYYYISFTNLFSRPSIVTVTVAFGSYSFAQAKWIDLAWDIAVGRIGQVLLASISYVVITRSMLTTMETTAVPHRLFADMAFLGPSSWMTLWSVATVTPKAQLWKAWKGHLLVITLIMAYLITFPTMVSAMTGYITTFSTRIEIEDVLVDYYSDELLVVLFTIGNCSIFNMDNGCHIVNLPNGIELTESGEQFSNTVYWSLYDAYYCQTELHASSTCGSLDAGDKNIMIDPVDSLDIYLPDDLYAYNGRVYDGQYIKEHGQCQPGKEYHWGFSYQLLFIFAILNLLWAVSVWSLWLTATGEYHIRNSYGAYRAAVDLGTLARETLGERVKDMSNVEIKKELEKKKTGIVRSDEGTRKLISRDWTLFYKKRYRLPFKARVAAVGEDIRLGMVYLGTIPAKIVLWQRGLWPTGRRRTANRSEIPLFALQSRGYRLSSSSRE